MAATRTPVAPTTTRRAIRPQSDEPQGDDTQILIDSGALFHANLNTLHPLGFGLVVQDGRLIFVDRRSKPDLRFDAPTLEAGMKKIKDYTAEGGEGQKTMQRRKTLLGYAVQRVPER